MNIELRWVERANSLLGQSPTYMVRVLQYRERMPTAVSVVQGAPNLTFEYRDGGFTDWRDVPVEVE